MLHLEHGTASLTPADECGYIEAPLACTVTRMSKTCNRVPRPLPEPAGARLCRETLFTGDSLVNVTSLALSRARRIASLGPAHAAPDLTLWHSREGAPG